MSSCEHFIFSVRRKQKKKKGGAPAQLPRWWGWCCVFKVRGGCLKGIETDQGASLEIRNIKLSHYTPLPASLSFHNAWTLGSGGSQGWGQRGGGGTGQLQLPLNQFLFVNIKHLHSLWPTALANINTTRVCALNSSHVGQMAQPSQCSQSPNKWIAA